MNKKIQLSPVSFSAEPNMDCQTHPTCGETSAAGCGIGSAPGDAAHQPSAVQQWEPTLSWVLRYSKQESQNHWMVWVGGDLKSPFSSTPHAMGWLPHTRSGFPEPHPTLASPGMGHPQQLCQGLTTLWMENFLLISSFNLPFLNLKQLPCPTQMSYY